MGTLQQVISNSGVTDAIFIYDLLVSKGVEIPVDVKQELLELVCFYNQDESLMEEMFEARDIASKSNRSKESDVPSWKSGFADSLFNSFETKTPQAYNAIICGLYKYNQKTKAKAMFEEAVEKQIPLDIKVYNYAIQSYNIENSLEVRYNAILGLLKEINDLRLKPNLNTLNAVLFTLNGPGHYILIRQYSFQMLAEFKNLGIEPSLGTWSIILRTFCRDKVPISHILVDILNEIENKPLTIQHPWDTYFFYTAMSVCHQHLNDEALAHRLDAILNSADNFNELFADIQQEIIYYRHYLNVCLKNEPLPKFMELYEQLVPHTLSLETTFLNYIFNQINLSGAIEYIPRIWSDMVITGPLSVPQEELLSLMVDNEPQSDIEMHKDLNEKFAAIAWDIFNRLENKSKLVESWQYNSTAVSNIIILLSRGNRLEDASTILRKFLNQNIRLTGPLLPQALEVSLDLCVKQKQPSIAIQIIDYALLNNGYDARGLAQTLLESMTLDERYLYKISKLVGPDVINSSRN